MKKFCRKCELYLFCTCEGCNDESPYTGCVLYKDGSWLLIDEIHKGEKNETDRKDKQNRRIS